MAKLEAYEPCRRRRPRVEAGDRRGVLQSKQLGVEAAWLGKWPTSSPRAEGARLHLKSMKGERVVTVGFISWFSSEFSSTEGSSSGILVVEMVFGLLVFTPKRIVYGVSVIRVLCKIFLRAIGFHSKVN